MPPANILEAIAPCKWVLTVWVEPKRSGAVQLPGRFAAPGVLWPSNCTRMPFLWSITPDFNDWEMDRLVGWSLENAIGRSPVQDNFSYLANQISAAAEEAGVDGVDAGISIPHSLFDVRILQLPYMEEDELPMRPMSRFLGRI